METVRVQLGDRSYDVVVYFDLLSDLPEMLRDRDLGRANVAVITSPIVGGYYYETVHDALADAGAENVARFDVPDGECNKSLEMFCDAVSWLAGFAPDPSIEPVVLTLGGGVVGDLGGFAAACFRRGVPYVQVPTTLLAAVDSSVGGKTAVNLPEGKNLVGAFYQPRLVCLDLETFSTLPLREIRAGMGEVIKYGVALDADLFHYLEESMDDLMDLDEGTLMKVVTACVQLKADVVARDELDRSGVRICLNFGHTLGHAIETACGGSLSHGECVSLGMMAAVSMSVDTGICDSEVPERLEVLLERAELPVHYEGLHVDDVLDIMQHDKKFVSGRNRFVLLTDVGEWTEETDVPASVVRKAAESVLA